MLFNSLTFLIFFPIVCLVYFVIPKKIRYIWLLIASYYFYMSWNAKYAILIIISTVVTYATGIVLEKLRDVGSDKKRKLALAACILINLGILFYFKYFNFATIITAKAFKHIGIVLYIPTIDVLLPVGISFYTFQALGYSIDVYRGEIDAEKNILRYALYVSFFPQLVAGPIERSKNLLHQLKEDRPFDFEDFREGFLLMLWGFFLKIVLADRIAIFVDTVYGDIKTFPGMYLVVATILFAFQIYCDFYGYSTIAMGAAKILRIQLMENFNAPYLATSVAGFWRGWHISLTTWFRDYLYIPLGGNRKGFWRKQFNKMVVFLTSGLWHGASLAFVAWGGINGLWQIIGDVLMPVRSRAKEILHIHDDKIGTKLIKGIITFILVDFAWIFFRANRLKEAFAVIKSIAMTYNPWVLFDGSLYNCGLEIKNYQFMWMMIGVLLFADYCKSKKIEIRRVLLEQDFLIRSVSIAVFITFILIFGKYGPGYDESNFIYFQF